MGVNTHKTTLWPKEPSKHREDDSSRGIRMPSCMTAMWECDHQLSSVGDHLKSVPAAGVSSWGGHCRHPEFAAAAAEVREAVAFVFAVAVSPWQPESKRAPGEHEEKYGRNHGRAILSRPVFQPTKQTFWLPPGLKGRNWRKDTEENFHAACQPHMGWRADKNKTMQCAARKKQGKDIATPQ